MDSTLLIATFIKIGVYFGVVLTFVAYSVYAERRFSAIIQDRVGPNRTGIPTSILGFKKDIALPLGGLTQPVADGLKFILKEDFTPAHVRKVFFWLAPCLTMVPSLITIAVIPFTSPIEWNGDATINGAIADLDVGPLFIFAISSLAVYGIAIAGWASNSKYPFLGGVRASAQMISYEIALGLSIIPVLLHFGDLNLGRIVQHQSENGWLLLPLWNENGSVLSMEYWRTSGEQWLLWIPMFLAFIIFSISIFAETNRTPFDLAECETELVGGYHTEYSSMKFALFFLGEYAAMVVGSALIVTLFLGGWSLPFGWDQALAGEAGGFPLWVSLVHLGVFLGKVVFFILFFILVRWSIPRFRYDQLMKLGWVVFFELALINILLTALLIAKPSLDKQGPGTFWIALAGLAVFSALMFFLAKTVDNIVGPGKRTAPDAQPVTQ